MYRFSYIFVLIGALIGGWELLNTFAFAESAPQQGAGAAMALAWAVLPYIFARACEKVGGVTISEALERQWRREQGEAVVVKPTVPTPPQMPKFHPQTGKPLP